MIIVAVAFVFGFVRPFVVEAYKIPSGSMEDTLLVGDRILVWKCMYGIKVPGIKKRLFAFHQPRRGDVFVFLPPHERDKNFIKRILLIFWEFLIELKHQYFIHLNILRRRYICFLKNLNLR